LAGSIEISPVRVDLSSAVRVAVLTVHNTGEGETVMQVSINHWPATGDPNRLESTDDLLVTPTTFRLAGGAQQIVRLGLRGEAPLRSEAAYRLIIEEVPNLQEQGATRMLLVVRHDLPVFVAPAAPLVHNVVMVIECAKQGAEIHLRNLGNSHLKVLRIALRNPVSGATQGDWKTFDYLLPGGETSWRLSTVAPDARALTYTATATTEQGLFTADVQNQCL
jgi:fimbrial chaperone protein